MSRSLNLLLTVLGLLIKSQVNSIELSEALVLNLHRLQLLTTHHSKLKAIEELKSQNMLIMIVMNQKDHMH